MAETEKLVDPAPNQIGDISASTSAFPLAGLQDATDSDRFHQGVAIATKDSTGDGAYVSATAPLPVGYGQMRVINSALSNGTGTISTSPNYSTWDQVGLPATVWDGSGTAAVWEIKAAFVDIPEVLTGPAGNDMELLVWGSDYTTVTSDDNEEMATDSRVGAVIPLTRTRDAAGGERWQATDLSIVPFGAATAGVYTGSIYLAVALRYAGTTGWAFVDDTIEILARLLVRRVG